jgi:RNA polymerase sigma-70 factor (ECF subfamily)
MSSQANPVQQGALDALWERARAAWPTLARERDGFERYLLERLESPTDPEALRRACAEDLFLTFACVERMPGAVDAFLSAFGPTLARQIRSIDPRPQAAEELQQELLVRLFLPPKSGAPPRIAAYSGRGPLRVWLKLAARRLALNRGRDSARTKLAGSGVARAQARLSVDLELSFIRGQYEGPFREAIRAGFEGLQPDERTILRLYYRERLSASELAIALRTSRPTAHRRLAAAREALTLRVREDLQRRLRIGPAQLEGLIELLTTNMVAALNAELRTELDGR